MKNNIKDKTSCFLCKAYTYDKDVVCGDIYIIYSPRGEMNGNAHDFIKIVRREERNSVKLGARSSIMMEENGYIRVADEPSSETSIPWRTMRFYKSWSEFTTVFIELENGDKININIPSYPYEMSQRETLLRYPRVIAHLICESLGYFSPMSAANAVVSYKLGSPFACEWYSHMCHCKTKQYFNDEEIVRIGKEVLRKAIRSRKHHAGYMAEYANAINLVKREVNKKGATSKMLASWF